MVRAVDRSFPPPSQHQRQQHDPAHRRRRDVGGFSYQGILENWIRPNRSIRQVIRPIPPPLISGPIRCGWRGREPVSRAYKLGRWRQRIGRGCPKYATNFGHGRRGEPVSRAYRLRGGRRQRSPQRGGRGDADHGDDRRARVHCGVMRDAVADVTYQPARVPGGARDDAITDCHFHSPKTSAARAWRMGQVLNARRSP